MKRNEIGKWGVIFRAEKDMLHREMAKRLGVGAAYLSNIEHGRKMPPDNWCERVSVEFDLTLQERTTLLLALMRSKKEITVPIHTDFEARVMVAFEQNKSTIDETKVGRIEEILSTGDNPNDNTQEQRAPDP